MESWEGENYYTYNHTRQVELMNQSTAEWSLGYFPPNLYAINDTYSDNYPVQFPDDALVIQNADQALAGTQPVEALVFGLTSALALAWALFWAWSEYRNGTWKTLRTSLVSDEADRRPDGVTNGEVESGAGASGLANKFPTAEKFEQVLLSKYYESVVSELEAPDHDSLSAVRNVESEDLEAVQEIIRKRYDIEFDLFSRRDAPVNERELQQHRSNAALAHIREVVLRWDENSVYTDEWDEPERQRLRSMANLLRNM